MLDKIKKYLVGFRKYSIMLIMIVIAISFRLTNYINGEEMVELLKVTGAAFMASNMAERIVDAIKAKVK